MREIKSNIELKRAYYSRPEMYFNERIVEAFVQTYGDKPATTGEAVYIFGQRLLDLLSRLPIIGRYMS